MRLKTNDVYLDDPEFRKDLEVKRQKEEDELFELIMDSVCNGKGKRISKRREEISKEDCKMFKEKMKEIGVKILRKEN